MGKFVPGKKVLFIRRIPYFNLLIALPFIQLLLFFLLRPLRHPPRFSTPPWSHPLPLSHLLDPSSALITPIPEKQTDGLGHRFAVINFELNLAKLMSVRYIHRVAGYESLTRSDKYAIERLFGWLDIKDTRAEVLKGCVVERREIVGCAYPADYPVCLSLKPESPFKRLVNIPKEKVDCLLTHEPECKERLKNWARKYGRNTLFQMTSSLCHYAYRYGNFQYTKLWFRNMYWGYHRVVRLLDLQLKRRVTLDKKRFQIGVHIRRGDFLNQTKREVIPDSTYAELVCEIKESVDGLMGVDVPTDVHIFSEGIPKAGSLYMHDIDLMTKMYVTEEGFAVEPLPHWRKMIRNCKGDLRVKTHVATDTVTAIHDLIAADAFIGSKSGMSVHIVDAMTRGVSVVPVQREYERPEGDWSIGYKYHTENGSAIVDRQVLRTCFKEMKRVGGFRGIVLP